MIKKFFTLLCLCTLCIGSAWGEDVTGKVYSFGTSVPDGWAVTASTTAASGYLKLKSGETIETSSITTLIPEGYVLDSSIRLNVTSGTFGTWDGAKNVTIVAQILDNDGQVLSLGSYTKEGLGNKENTWVADDYPIEISKPSDVSKVSKLKLTFTIPNNADVLRVKSVKLSYSYKEGSDPTKTLQSIAISGTPAKLEYKVGKSFDRTGLTVTGTYDDNSTTDLTNSAEWTFNPATFTSAGNTTVSVTATVGGKSDTKNYDVTVTEFVQTYANTYTSDVTLSTEGGTSASTAKVVIDGTEYAAIKAGTGKAAGACVVTIPANTKTLHFHVAGWKGENVTLTVTIDNDETGTEYALVADDGVTGSATTFTLQNDPETNDYFYLDPQGATTITFTATSGNRFVLFGVNAERTQDVTIAGTGYSSFSSAYAVTIPTGITAYYATAVEGTKVSMTEVEGGVIPANEGVIIKGEASQTYTFTETVSDKSFENNKLVAVSERIEGLAPEVTIDDVTYKNYVFTQGQFHPFTTGATVNVGAGKAYLRVVKPADPSAKLEMNFDGGTTGIDAIHSIQVNDNAIYNLRGERVNTMSKGNIYIVNGKKYLFK